LLVCKICWSLIQWILFSLILERLERAASLVMNKVTG